MKKTKLQGVLFTLLGFISVSAFGQEPPLRNDYSSSIMLKPPTVYEDQNYKTDSEQRQQLCRDLRQQIDELGKKPLQRSAAKDRYQKECVGN